MTLPFNAGTATPETTAALTDVATFVKRSGTPAWGVITFADFGKFLGQVVGTGTTVEHKFSITTSTDTNNANVLSVQHLDQNGACAVRALDRLAHEHAAFGYGNFGNGGVFDGYSYQEGSNIDDGGIPGAPGLEWVLTGYWRGTYATRPRARFLPHTQDFIFYAPGTGNIGTQCLHITPAGNVATGMASLAAGAKAGFLAIPKIANTPTAEPVAEPGMVHIAFDVTNNKIVAFVADETKTLIYPKWYMAMTEGSQIAGADQLFYGPSFAAFGAIFNDITTMPTSGNTTPKNGTSYRVFNGTTQAWLFLNNAIPTGQTRGFDPMNVESNFLISVWVRPQTAFPGTISRIINHEGVFNLAINSTGKVIADHIGGQNTIGNVAATQLALNTWSHILFWRDDAAKTLNLQVDGGTIQSSNYVGDPQVTNSNPSGIGGNAGTGSGFNQFYKGDMSDMAMWNTTCLTSAQRATLYNAGAGRFFTWPAWGAPAGGSGSWLKTAALT